MRDGGVDLPLLATLLRSPAAGTALSPAQWEAVVHILRDARLLGSLAARAREAGVFEAYPAYAQRHLAAMATFSARQAQQVRFECAELDRLLGAAGIRPIFLKGAGYTLRGSRNASGRIYTDIDALVRQEELAAAQDLLKANAWYAKPLRRYDERYYRRWAHELPPMKHLLRRAVLDLHHNIVPPVSGRAPDAALLRETVEATREGPLVLSPPAAVLHSLVHLLLNEDWSDAFRDLHDVSLLLEEFGDGDFWDDLEVLAGRTGFGRELYLGLALLTAVFDTRAPAPLWDRLAARYRRGSRLLLQHVLLPALCPQHPLVCGGRQRLGFELAYLRGHWLKMPLPTLVTHLTIKAGLSAGEVLFGKHAFARPPAGLPLRRHDEGG